MDLHAVAVEPVFLDHGLDRALRFGAAVEQAGDGAHDVSLLRLVARCGDRVGGQPLDRRVLPPQRHRDRLAAVLGAEPDAHLLPQHQPALDDQHLLQHRDDEGVAFLADRWGLGDLAADRHALDLDAALPQHLLHQAGLLAAVVTETRTRPVSRHCLSIRSLSSSSGMTCSAASCSMRIPLARCGLNGPGGAGVPPGCASSCWLRRSYKAPPVVTACAGPCCGPGPEQAQTGRPAGFARQQGGYRWQAIA